MPNFYCGWPREHVRLLREAWILTPRTRTPHGRRRQPIVRIASPWPWPYRYVGENDLRAMAEARLKALEPFLERLAEMVFKEWMKEIKSAK